MTERLADVLSGGSVTPLGESRLPKGALELPCSQIELTESVQGSSGPGYGPLSAPKSLLVPLRELLHAAISDLPSWVADELR